MRTYGKHGCLRIDTNFPEQPRNGRPAPSYSRSNEASVVLITEESRDSSLGLSEAGLVEAHGDGKGRTWHLSAATYRRLGAKAAYVRQRGFEPAQQEQMVLQYVEKHGLITRKEAAEHCRVNGPQAYRLFDRLAELGLLAREGERGWSVAYRKGTK